MAWFLMKILSLYKIYEKTEQQFVFGSYDFGREKYFKWCKASQELKIDTWPYRVTTIT